MLRYRVLEIVYIFFSFHFNESYYSYLIVSYCVDKFLWIKKYLFTLFYLKIVYVLPLKYWFELLAFISIKPKF